jgi:hypothetical protein
VIAKVNENHAAVVATRVDPAAQRDGLAEQGLIDQTTVVGAHEIVRIAGAGGRRGMLRRTLLPRNIGRRAGRNRPTESMR